MNVDPLSSLAGSCLQSLIGRVTGSSKPAANPSNTIDPSSLALPQDKDPQLSPFARVMSKLQELQQQDPDLYKAVTQKISTNLQQAAQKAQANGNTDRANQLSQLASDFKNASDSGALPNVQDLAKATEGHHFGYHHHHAAAFGDQPSQSDPLDPITLITGTLSSAGASSTSF